MRTAFIASWYDTKKVEAKARAAGWNGADGLLDVYAPEEDPNGSDELECRDLQSAVTHLRNVVAEGWCFYGQGEVLQIEIGGPRCKYCTCRGSKLVKRIIVDETGFVEEHNESDCLDDD